MASRENHEIHELFHFLDRLNTSNFEVEIISDFAEGLFRDFGNPIETKTKLILNSFESMYRLFYTISDNRPSTFITHISFTNVILSGTIDFPKRKIDIIFHTLENIQNVIYQLVDVPIPTFELNIKLLHTRGRQRNIQS